MKNNCCRPKFSPPSTVGTLSKQLYYLHIKDFHPYAYEFSHFNYCCIIFPSFLLRCEGIYAAKVQQHLTDLHCQPYCQPSPPHTAESIYTSNTSTERNQMNSSPPPLLSLHCKIHAKVCTNLAFRYNSWPKKWIRFSDRSEDLHRASNNVTSQWRKRWQVSLTLINAVRRWDLSLKLGACLNLCQVTGINRDREQSAVHFTGCIVYS